MLQNSLIKSASEIDKMRTSCQLARQVLNKLKPHVKLGATTELLNDVAHKIIVDEMKAIPAPLNYRGFPKSICTTINNQVCHGIPDANKVLKKGDILNIDVTIIKDGFHGDTSAMFMLEGASIQAKRLVKVTYECLVKGILAVSPGKRIRDIALAIQNHAFAHNYSVVKEFCGHGIGRSFHEEPQVIHCVTNDPCMDFQLEAGMTFTIEPMINQGSAGVKILSDGWTVVTRDRNLSAQWEHTILVTKDGFEVLTISPDDSKELH